MQELLDAYENCETNKCIVPTTESSFFVVDSTSKRSEIQLSNTTPEYPHFSFTNTQNKQLSLICVDECIFFGQDGKKCDFAIHDETVFCFIELKRGLGKNEILKSENKDKAINQLINTITAFSSVIDFNTRFSRTEAYACIGYDTCVPQCISQDLHMTKLFWNRFRIHLQEGNHKKFS